jgi:hypothetical protein
VFQRLLCLISLLSIVILAGCAAPRDPADRRDISELAASIRALGADIDPEEAERAAQIAYEYTHQLAIEYQITDPPLIHNTKVNMGLRPRGLCWHWAEDMEARLLREQFRTLDMHRAIANADNPFRIDHSTAIVSRRGDTMEDGIVLDPWRKGGVLFWAPLQTDTKYNWVPREKVLDAKRRRMIAEGLL